jgi:hypothetical protein
VRDEQMKAQGALGCGCAEAKPREAVKASCCG